MAIDKVLVLFLSFFPCTNVFWDMSLVIYPSILDHMYLAHLITSFTEWLRLEDISGGFSSLMPCSEQGQLEQVVQSQASCALDLSTDGDSATSLGIVL